MKFRDYIEENKELENHNRKVRWQARRHVKLRLLKLYSPEAVDNIMKDKHVHHTCRGLELVDVQFHCKKHGRGNKGPDGVYKNEI